MGHSSIDHAAVAASRITGAHFDKPKFMAIVRALTEAFDDIETVADDVAKLLDLDGVNDQGLVVRGDNLDVLGDIVGQKRRILAAIPRLYFGFDDDTTALGFGEDSDSNVGGFWFEEGDIEADDAVLMDDAYRKAIRCRRYINQLLSARADDVYWVLVWIMTPETPMQVHDLGGMTFTVTIGHVPDTIQRALLLLANLIPRPAGVMIDGIMYYDHTSPVFGFDDDTAASGFGEDDNPETGGYFAEELT